MEDEILIVKLKSAGFKEPALTRLVEFPLDMCGEDMGHQFSLVVLLRCKSTCPTQGTPLGEFTKINFADAITTNHCHMPPSTLGSL
jgi:hypothetical protein